MVNYKKTCGIPDNLPPLTFRELNGYFWFAGAGALLIALGIIPNIAAIRWAVVLALTGWVLIPMIAWSRQSPDDPRRIARKALAAQIRRYTAVVVAFSVGFAVWAHHLNVAWPIIIGALFTIDAFANTIASLTEWWRLSMFGHSIGLMICGFAYPFVGQNKLAILVGSAVLAGSVLSAGILYAQVRHHQAVSITSIAIPIATPLE